MSEAYSPSASSPCRTWPNSWNSVVVSSSVSSVGRPAAGAGTFMVQNTTGRSPRASALSRTVCIHAPPDLVGRAKKSPTNSPTTAPASSATSQTRIPGRYRCGASSGRSVNERPYSAVAAANTPSVSTRSSAKNGRSAPASTANASRACSAERYGQSHGATSAPSAATAAASARAFAMAGPTRAPSSSSTAATDGAARSFNACSAQDEAPSSRAFSRRSRTIRMAVVSVSCSPSEPRATDASKTSRRRAASARSASHGCEVNRDSVSSHGPVSASPSPWPASPAAAAAAAISSRPRPARRSRSVTSTARAAVSATRRRV